MSAIDQYKHKVIGIFECPSSFPFVYHNQVNRKIIIYELLEDIPKEENSFDGKKGDIIVGGGNGEADSLRISVPNAFYFFADKYDNEIEFNTMSEILKTFWNNNSAYIFCEGYSKLGWNIEDKIEYWLAENICRLLVFETNYFQEFKEYYLQKTKLNSQPIT